MDWLPSPPRNSVGFCNVHFLGVWCQFRSFLNCIPFYLFYFIVCTIIINNPIISVIFCSWGPFILPYCNFCIDSKVFLAVRFGVFFRGEMVH